MDTSHFSVSHITPVSSTSGVQQQQVREHMSRPEDVQGHSNEYKLAEVQFLSKESLIKALDGINKTLEVSRTHLKFTLHEELEEYYVQVINEQTQEVIKEIPPKKLLDIVAEIWKLAGILIDEKRQIEVVMLFF